MAHNVTVPQMGESISEGIISKFLVAEGTVVGVDTPVYELETDKVTTEVTAGAAGKIAFSVKEGETIKVGGTVATIDTSVQAPAAPAKTAMPAAAAAPAKAEAPAAARNEALSPAVKKMVAETKVDPAAIPGSGRHGQVTKGDVLAHLEKGTTPTPVSAPAAKTTDNGPRTTDPAPAPTRKKMSALRQRIAQRLVAAQHTAAILTTFNEVDMGPVMELRKKWKESFEKQHGVGLGFMSFFTSAACQALAKYPLLNSQIEGSDVVSFDGVHMGIAVGTEKGLVVPVLRHAQRLSFAGIEQAIKAYALKARDGKLAIDDMQGGTFTITNGGVYGSLMSTPIINPPQSGILGLHAIKDRPMAVNGQVVIRPMMYLALSYDHRIVDGAEAVGFLVRVKELIEAPERLILGL